MKTKVIAIFSATALAISSFVACNKTERNIETEMKQLSTMSSNNCVAVDFSAADFGELHNQYVISLYNGVNFSNLNTAKAQILNNFKNIQIDASAFQMSELDFRNIVLDVNQQLANHNYDLREWIDNPLSNRSSFPYIVTILNEIDNITVLENFNIKLMAIEQDAKANLTCNDLDIVLGALKVAKSSARLWAPISIGGEGLFDNSFGNNNSLQLFRGWKGALKGDVGSSAAYFLALGVGGAVGLAVPGTNVAILGGWAISAAIGSGMGALGI